MTVIHWRFYNIQGGLRCSGTNPQLTVLGQLSYILEAYKDRPWQTVHLNPIDTDVGLVIIRPHSDITLDGLMDRWNKRFPNIQTTIDTREEAR